MAQLGRNIFISADGTTSPIAGTRSDEIRTSVETIEISSPTSGQWKERVAGRKDWSFTVNWIVAASTEATGTKLVNLLNVGTTYNIKVCERSGSSVVVILTGTAICKTATVTGTIGNLAHGTFQFEGNGPLAEPVPTESE